jgi:hypothetical protein
MDEVQPRGHEHKDASARAILWVAAGLVIAAIVIHAGTRFYELWLNRHYPSPVGEARITGPAVQPPPPQLQRFPTLDWQQLRATDETVLHSYGWLDRDQGLIRIPIERAIEHTAQRGLPSGPPPASPAPAQKGAAP